MRHYQSIRPILFFLAGVIYSAAADDFCFTTPSNITTFYPISNNYLVGHSESIQGYLDDMLKLGIPIANITENSCNYLYGENREGFGRSLFGFYNVEWLWWNPGAPANEEIRHYLKTHVKNHFIFSDGVILAGLVILFAALIYTVRCCYLSHKNNTPSNQSLSGAALFQAINDTNPDYGTFGNDNDTKYDPPDSP